ncbi:MAG: hypothetical protein ACK53Y_25815 [bacterium]
MAVIVLIPRPLTESPSAGRGTSSSELWRVRFFFSEPSAAGGYNWLPAPLGCNLANAGNTKQWRTTVTESSFFFMMFIIIRSQEYTDPQ